MLYTADCMFVIDICVKVLSMFEKLWIFFEMEVPCGNQRHFYYHRTIYIQRKHRFWHSPEAHTLPPLPCVLEPPGVFQTPAEIWRKHFNLLGFFGNPEKFFLLFTFEAPESNLH